MPDLPRKGPVIYVTYGTYLFKVNGCGKINCPDYEKSLEVKVQAAEVVLIKV